MDFASSIRAPVKQDKVERDCSKVICGAPTTCRLGVE